MPNLAALGGTPVRDRPFHSWPIYDQREIDALSEVVRSGRWNRWEGDCVRRFESVFADYMGCRYVVAVSSGTGALESVLAGIELKPGEEVILPAYCFTSPVNAVMVHGGVPVFVDVDPGTYNLDPARVEEAVTSRTRAILPLHLFGRPADMDELMAISRRHNVALVEDAALATGSRWRDQAAGGLGDAGIFSCQAEKNLNCGEGGIVVTDDERIWKRTLSYSDYWKGQLLPQPGWDALTSGFRMTEFQAAILLIQLTRLDEQSEVRHNNGSYLDAQLRVVDGIGVKPEDPRVTRDSHSLYMFRYQADRWAGVHRNVFVTALQAEGIPGVTGYPRPVYQNPLFQEPDRCLPHGSPLRDTTGRAPDYANLVCPVAERACFEEAVWLRQQTLLCRREDVDDIVAAVVKLRENIDELGRLAGRG
jgi:dTDP-4-amino-4,6-dideoxygalactose transaminase